jgi:hypothetical protein
LLRDIQIEWKIVKASLTEQAWATKIKSANYQMK